MSENDFNECTPKYFRLRLFGMRQAQEQEYRNQWEQTRWAVATSMSPHIKKPIAPNKLIKFSWEQSNHADIVATVSKYSDIFAKLTPPAEA